MSRRPMRILLPLDGPAEETPSMISQQPLELKDPVTCQRVWQSSTSTNQVKKEKMLSRARNLQLKKTLHLKATEWREAVDTYGLRPRPLSGPLHFLISKTP